jgi:hypothetical protein
MSELWELPESDPVAPGYDAERGFVTEAGFDSSALEDGGFAESLARQWWGVNFYKNGARVADLHDVEGGKFDKIRRIFWNSIYKRLLALGELSLANPIYLGATPADWSSTPLAPFAEECSWPATGSGKSLALTWGTGNTDPRAVPRDNGNIVSPIQPGDWVWSGGGQYGVARLVDVTWGLGQSATLTLSKPINTGRGSSSVTVARENRLATFPLVSLDPVLSGQCVWCRKSALQFWRTLRSAYPSVTRYQKLISADGNWHCARMGASEIDPATVKFGDTTPCSDSTCPLYSRLRCGWVPNALELSKIFGARGRYLTKLVPQDSGSESLRVGQENFDGLLLLMGLRIAHYTGSLEIFWKDFFGAGRLLHKTGILDENGWELFLDHEGYQQYFLSRTPAQPETDDCGLLKALDDVEKFDWAGGASASNRALVKTVTRTPLCTLERKIGVRRLSGLVPTLGKQQNQSYGDTSLTIRGAGDGVVQRVRRRSYASGMFRPNGGLEYEDDFVRTEKTTTMQSLQDGFQYNLMVRLRQFGDAKSAPTDKGEKTRLTGRKIERAVASGNLLTLEFALAEIEVSVPATVPYDTHFSSGGTTVHPKHSVDVVWNPLAKMEVTDAQGYLYPGDVLYLNDGVSENGGDLENWGLLCLSAEAFGGQDGTVENEYNAPIYGVPSLYATKHQARDKAVFWIGSESGKRVKAWLDSHGGTTGGGSKIWKVDQSGVSPAPIDDQGNNTGYAPVVYRSTATGAAEEVASDFWRYDASSGRLYVNVSAWPAADYVVSVVGWFFDNRHVHPVNNCLGIRKNLDDVCDHAWIRTALGTGGEDVYWCERYLDGGVETEYTSALFGVANTFERVWTRADFTRIFPPPGSVTFSGFTRGFISAPYSTTANMAEMLSRVVFQSNTKALKVTSYSAASLAAFRSEDIAEALMELEIEGGSVLGESYSEVNGSAEYSSSQAAVTQFSFLLYEGTVNGDDFTPSNAFAVPGGTLRRVQTGVDENNNPVYAYRGLVDMTAAVKFILDHFYENLNREYLLILGGPGLGPNSGSARDLALSYTPGFGGDYTGHTKTPALDDTASLATTEVTFSSASVGDLFVRLDKTKVGKAFELPDGYNAQLGRGTGVCHWPSGL